MAAIVEAVYPRVLQKAVYDTDRIDILRQSLNARQQRAHAPNDQPDLHTGFAGLIQLHDHFLVRQVVALEHQCSRVTVAGVGNLAIDELVDAAAAGVRRHQ